jgi:hypothetical protein
MSTTANALMQDAYEELGVYAPGETISAADEARAFSVLNEMIDEWAAENIFVYQLIPRTFNTIINQSAYTIGQNGSPTINASRPPAIAYGPGEANITISAVETSINVVSAVEFQALDAYGASAGTPDTLWYKNGYPNGTLTLLPKPSAVGAVAFNAWDVLLAFADPQTSYELSVGFYEAIRNNLAVMLKSYFTDAQLSPDVATKALTSKDWLRFQSLVSRATLSRFKQGPGLNNKTGSP